MLQIVTEKGTAFDLFGVISCFIVLLNYINLTLIIKSINKISSLYNQWEMNNYHAACSQVKPWPSCKHNYNCNNKKFSNLKYTEMWRSMWWELTCYRRSMVIFRRLGVVEVGWRGGGVWGSHLWRLFSLERDRLIIFLSRLRLILWPRSTMLLIMLPILHK